MICFVFQACGTTLMYSLHDSSGSFILMEQELDSAYVVTNRELDRETTETYTLDVSIGYRIIWLTLTKTWNMVNFLKLVFLILLESGDFQLLLISNICFSKNIKSPLCPKSIENKDSLREISFSGEILISDSNYNRWCIILKYGL